MFDPMDKPLVSQGSEWWQVWRQVQCLTAQPMLDH